MEKTVNKMMRIVRGDTDGSLVYADMLLSILNREHKVDIGYWCYKADLDDFNTIIEVMRNHGSDMFWEFENCVLPHVDELRDYVNKNKGERND